MAFEFGWKAGEKIRLNLVYLERLQGTRCWWGIATTPSMKTEWEVKLAELMVGIRDVQADIWEIKSNLSWINSQLIGVLEAVRQITSHTSGLDTRLGDAE